MRTESDILERIPEGLDLLDNALWSFCADDPLADHLTYDQFELGPDFIIPAGTKVFMPGLWGWTHSRDMTDPVTVSLTPAKACTVKRAVSLLLFLYHQRVDQGRFFFIEQVRYVKPNTIEIVWGT